MPVNYTKGDTTPGTFSCRVYCMSNGASDPDGLIDEAGVVDQTANSSGLDQPSSGKYTLTLNGTYRKIVAHVVLEDTTLGQVCQVYQVDDVTPTTGAYASPAMVYWATFTTSTGAAVQTNDKQFVIDLELTP